MRKIFVTGANGFVGKVLVKELAKHSYDVIEGTRDLYGELQDQKNWAKFVQGCYAVVHLAARVHVMSENAVDPQAEFDNINVEASKKIALAAKLAGVKRFIFLSSVKVNGEMTFDSPFSASDKPNPQDEYGCSKLNAELELLKLHEPNIFEVVIIRPPLVYGPGVKANFERLSQLVKKGMPLPFGSVLNRRSLVSVYNLCDLVTTCIEHPKAAGEIFLVSDDVDYSLKDMVILLGKTLKKEAHLISVPVFLMTLALKSIGKKSYSDRMFGNLHVEISKTKNLLGWRPKHDFLSTFKDN